MKVTADTITDEQIGELWREAAGAPLPHADPDLAYLCNVARSTPVLAADVCERYSARARCAEIWNARHGGES